MASFDRNLPGSGQVHAEPRVGVVVLMLLGNLLGERAPEWP
jgi:hypothetical protein